MYNLPRFQKRFLAQKLSGDDAANLSAFNHMVDFFESSPANIVGFAGKQHNVGKGSGAAQTVVIVKGNAVLAGFQKFKFFGGCMNAGFFVPLPDAGFQTGFAGFSGTAGIFPGAGVGFAGGPAGQ